MDNSITEVDILDESKECFLIYAEEVLTDRAIPSAEDGLLSVQRKILWTMSEILNMDNKSKTKKSASVVGSTLASSYFHGDASCYGALCKMSQEYLMRYPLINGQGSLGTQEANNMQASARYTEAKPSIYADLMFTDYGKKVVPEVPTYNNEYMEPVVLPGLFPNALVNGREAIGVSMAHNSLPMNLTEVCEGIVAYIQDKNIDINGLMNYIKGPDFPLGGVVINSRDIYQAYATGKSMISLKVRGDYVVEDNKIIFNSIPYRTYRNKIKEQINDNIDEFAKYFKDFDDESSVGINKLIFYLNPGVSAKTAVDALFELTDLQTTLSYNMNYIVEGTPRLCSLKDLIIAYYNHQIDVILAATAFDKKKAEARAHIIRGLLIAIDKIDEVIALIKSSESKAIASQKLMAFLTIDEIQANAILEMKLGKLTRIDKTELLEELAEKEAIILECVHIIEDANYRDSILIQKIEAMKGKYGDKRRTVLENLDLIPKTKEEKEIAKVEPEKCVVVMTESGNIKRIPASSYRAQRRNTKGIKNQDDITNCVIRTNTIDSLMIFTNLGQMYRLLVNDIPEGTNASKGTPIGALVELEKNEKPQVIYSIYRDTDAKYIVLTTKNGLIKKTSLEECMSTKKKKGLSAIIIREGDALASVFLAKSEDIVMVSEQGKAIRFALTDITPTGRNSQGVKGMTLAADDKITAAAPIRDINDKLAIFLSTGYGKKIELTELPKQARGGKGVIVSKTKGVVQAIALMNDEDTVLLVGERNSVCISGVEVPTMSRTAEGNVMIKDSGIISASKV